MLSVVFLRCQKNNEKSKLFYYTVVAEGIKLTGEPSLDRVKSLPKHHHDVAHPHPYETPEACFRQWHFEAIDIVVCELRWQFDETMLGPPRTIENQLSSRANGEKSATSLFLKLFSSRMQKMLFIYKTNRGFNQVWLMQTVRTLQLKSLNITKVRKMGTLMCSVVSNPLTFCSPSSFTLAVVLHQCPLLWLREAS